MSETQKLVIDDDAQCPVAVPGSGSQVLGLLDGSLVRFPATGLGGSAGAPVDLSAIEAAIAEINARITALHAEHVEPQFIDPAADDQADPTHERSLAWFIDDAGGEPVNLVFRPQQLGDPIATTDGRPLIDGDGRTKFEFYLPVYVPDNVTLTVESGVILIFDLSRNGPQELPSSHGQLVLGTGGVALPTGVQVFQDLTPFKNAVWAPRSVFRRVELAWWGADNDPETDDSQHVKSAFSAIPSGGELALPDNVRINTQASQPAATTIGNWSGVTQVFVGTPDGEYAIEAKRSNGASMKGLSFVLASGNTAIEPAAFKYSRLEDAVLDDVTVAVAGGARISSSSVTINNIGFVDVSTSADYVEAKGIKIYAGCPRVVINGMRLDGYFLNNPIEMEHGLDSREWSAGLAVVVGDYITPTEASASPSTDLYYVEVGGNLGDTEPDWTDSDDNDMVSSGDVRMTFDTTYQKNLYVEINDLVADNLIGAIRIRDSGEVYLNRWDVNDFGDYSNGAPMTDTRLFDVRWTDAVHLDDVDAINTLDADDQENDFAKLYEVGGFYMQNCNAAQWKRGVRLMDELSNNIVLDDTNTMDISDSRHIVGPDGATIGLRAGVRTETGYAGAGQNIIDEAIDNYGV